MDRSYNGGREAGPALATIACSLGLFGTKWGKSVNERSTTIHTERLRAGRDIGMALGATVLAEVSR
jgi:hypothetical protein